MEQIRQRMEKIKQKQKGFTLVELIVVIAIIGILAGVMLPKYFGFTNDARKKAVTSEATAIRSIAEVIYAQTGTWPTITGTGDAATATGATNFTIGSNTTVFAGTIKSYVVTTGAFTYTKDTYSASSDGAGTITPPS